MTLALHFHLITQPTVFPEPNSEVTHLPVELEHQKTGCCNNRIYNNVRYQRMCGLSYNCFGNRGCDAVTVKFPVKTYWWLQYRSLGVKVVFFHHTEDKTNSCDGFQEERNYSVIKTFFWSLIHHIYYFTSKTQGRTGVDMDTVSRLQSCTREINSNTLFVPTLVNQSSY